VERLDIFGLAACRPQEPQQQRHVLKRITQRANHIRSADPTLSPCRLDRGSPVLSARHAARGMAILNELLGKVASAAPTADD